MIRMNAKWKRTVDRIQSPADFAEFVDALIADLRDNPEKWKNRDLASFFLALKAFVEDMDGYLKKIGGRMPEPRNWKAAAKLLIAGLAYE